MQEYVRIDGTCLKEDRDSEIYSSLRQGFKVKTRWATFKMVWSTALIKISPALYDTKRSVFQDYQIWSIPTEHLIDLQGKIAKIQLGAIS